LIDIKLQAIELMKIAADTKEIHNRNIDVKTLAKNLATQSAGKELFEEVTGILGPEGKYVDYLINNVRDQNLQHLQIVSIVIPSILRQPDHLCTVANLACASLLVISNLRSCDENGKRKRSKVD
jgi:hypothetical protein